MNIFYSIFFSANQLPCKYPNFNNIQQYFAERQRNQQADISTLPSGGKKSGYICPLVTLPPCKIADS